jgi:hypothetical protein
MPVEKTFRRLPLRDIITDAEKRTRDLIEHLNNTWLKQVAELRDLSRPTRKKSHFPTFKALNNVRERMLEIDLNTAALVDYLQQELEEIAEHARRERAIRR